MKRHGSRARLTVAPIILAVVLAGCGESVTADPHNPGAFITPSPSATTPTQAPASAPASTAEAGLRGVKPKTLDDKILADLDAYVVDAMHRLDIPGAEVAVVQDGKLVHMAGFGVREIGKSDPVTPDTLMRIGSVTKSMTTMMIGSLVDEGRLSWDTPAVDVLPWFETSDPKLTREITIRDLVSNATGLMRRDTEMIFTANQLDAEGVIRSVKTFGFDPKSEFRKTFGYSNQMVASGGYIAAHAAANPSGDLYADYVAQMQRRVFDPIGMTHTTFSKNTVLENADRSTPHAFDLDYTPVAVPLDEEEMLTPFAPAGGAWSNVNDMARYLLTELDHGRSPVGAQVVSAANLEKTWTKQVDLGDGKGYGLGWFSSSYKGQPRIGHGGDTVGFGSNIDFLPEAGIGIVVLTNAGTMSVFGGGVAGRLYELAFDQPFEIDAKVTNYYGAIRDGYKQAFGLVKSQADGDKAREFLGSYRNDALGEVDIQLSDGHLVLDAGSFATRLGSIGNNQYLLLDPPMPAGAIAFEHDKKGRPEFTFVTNNPDAPGSWGFKQS
jgi:CubicO group peptidase (beta-lactamase class C family)